MFSNVNEGYVKVKMVRYGEHGAHEILRLSGKAKEEAINGIKNTGSIEEYCDKLASRGLAVPKQSTLAKMMQRERVQGLEALSFHDQLNICARSCRISNNDERVVPLN